MVNNLLLFYKSIRQYFIHEEDIRLGDFGLSKSVADGTIQLSKAFGSIKYSDPEFLNNTKKYIRTKASDVYNLVVEIINGAREDIIPGTPEPYIELYTACWQADPGKRPQISQVTEALEKIVIGKTIQNAANITLSESNLMKNIENSSLNDSNNSNLETDSDDVNIETNYSYFQITSTMEKEALKISHLILSIMGKDNNQILMFCSKDGKKWDGPYSFFEFDQSSTVATITNFNSKLYLALNHDDQIYLTSTDDIDDWKRIKTSYHSSLPASFEIFNERLYIAYIGNKGEIFLSFNENMNTWNSIQKLEWNIDGAASLAAFQDKLYLAFVKKQGRYYKIFISYSNDCINWIDPFATDLDLYTHFSVALKTFKDNLYMVHVGSSYEINISCTGDGINWHKPYMTNPQYISHSSFSLENFDNKLYLTYFYGEWNNWKICIISSQDGRNWEKTMSYDLGFIPKPAISMCQFRILKKKQTNINEILGYTPKVLPADSINNNLDVTRQALGAVDIIGDIVKPFVPLIDMVTVLIEDIMEIYKNAQYNRKICDAFIGRIKANQASIKHLQQKKKEDETYHKNFVHFTDILRKANQASIKHLQQKKKEDETYHKNFVHFTDILRKVKDFLNYVTQLHGLKNFININNVREKSELLAKEFDGVIQDLHFTQTVSSQRQSNSDQQSSKVVNVVGAVSEAVEPFIPLISIASAQRQSKIDLQILKVDLEVVNSIEYAVKPFIPLIGIVTVLTGEIIKVYENAQYNKKICNAFIDHVEAAQSSVKYLQRKKEENLKIFQNETYYKNFVRFTEVLRQVKIFLEQVTRLLGYKRFLNTNNVKEKFESLAKEFDSVMYDLHFTPTVSAQRQSEIDQQSLMEDLNAIHGNIVDNKQQLNTALQEVLIIKGQIDSMDSNENVQPNDNPIKAAQISPTMLEDPKYPKKTDRRGKPPYIFKKILNYSIDVACKAVTIPDEKGDPQGYQKAQAQFTILGKLHDSDNIIKFYGFSTIDVRMALEICHGLTFLHTCSILHHDIRCDNIMIDKNRKVKIAKFDYARHTTGVTTDMKNATEVVHWMAPEKLRFGPRQSYNFKCEIF
ncbi:8324_t:CDS:2, partial [Entrophospora sp. SA101]